MIAEIAMFVGALILAAALLAGYRPIKGSLFPAPTLSSNVSRLIAPMFKLTTKKMQSMVTAEYLRSIPLPAKMERIGKPGRPYGKHANRATTVCSDELEDRPGWCYAMASDGKVHQVRISDLRTSLVV